MDRYGNSAFHDDTDSGAIHENLPSSKDRNENKHHIKDRHLSILIASSDEDLEYIDAELEQRRRNQRQQQRQPRANVQQQSACLGLSTFCQAPTLPKPTTPVLPDLVHKRGFIKWGIPLIPPPKKENVHGTGGKRDYSTFLMERLVWIAYQQGQNQEEAIWWPAIFYKHGYEEIVNYAPKIWNTQVPFWKRLQIVRLLLFDPTNPRCRVPVARVLGRPSCELVEMTALLQDDDPTEQPRKVVADFFWELPNILPMAACNIEFFLSNYRNNIKLASDLYYDFHRALDQVECLLYDCLGKHMPLMPVSSSGGSGYEFTWVQRARHAERAQWEQHKKYVGCMLCLCGPEEEEALERLRQEREAAKKAKKKKKMKIQLIQEQLSPCSSPKKKSKSKQKGRRSTRRMH
mmetsp:Transcript_32618/g.54642  ORF Transcript_32618/g.54642 Transcript_32618/m.54642 type:complete len:403 (-) Transcript_32618:741-1949(-)